MRAASLDEEVGVRRGYHCTTNISIMCLHVTVWFLDTQTKFFVCLIPIILRSIRGWITGAPQVADHGCALAALIHHTVLL